MQSVTSTRILEVQFPYSQKTFVAFDIVLKQLQVGSQVTQQGWNLATRELKGLRRQDGQSLDPTNNCRRGGGLVGTVVKRNILMSLA